MECYCICRTCSISPGSVAGDTIPWSVHCGNSVKYLYIAQWLWNKKESITIIPIRCVFSFLLFCSVFNFTVPLGVGHRVLCFIYLLHSRVDFCRLSLLQVGFDVCKHCPLVSVCHTKHTAVCDIWCPGGHKEHCTVNIIK